MKTRMGMIALMAAASMLGPMLGSSEAGDGRGPFFRDVVLYELNEQAQIVVVDPLEPPQRIATSGLEGKARRGTPLCSERLMAYAEAFYHELGIAVPDTRRCRVVAFGHSQVDLTPPFAGTIGGDFYVVVNSDKTNLVDAPELVVMAGTFSGVIHVADAAGVIIDISSGSFTPTAVLPGFPGGPPPSEPFVGKFRLPFKVRNIAVYKTARGVVPVGPDERALGDPTVRVEITFIGTDKGADLPRE